MEPGSTDKPTWQLQTPPKYGLSRAMNSSWVCQEICFLSRTYMRDDYPQKNFIDKQKFINCHISVLAEVRGYVVVDWGGWCQVILRGYDLWYFDTEDESHLNLTKHQKLHKFTIISLTLRGGLSRGFSEDIYILYWFEFSLEPAEGCYNLFEIFKGYQTEPLPASLWRR